MISVRQVISKGFIVLALLAAGASQAHAWEFFEEQADTSQPLLTATSDAFSGVYQLTITIGSDGKAKSIEYASPTDRQTFPISALPAGMVLLGDSGQNVVILQGTGFDPASGGELKLDYLVNGITGKRASVDIAIERTGAKWNLLSNDSAGRRIVKSAFFKANKFLGKLVGISKVTFSAKRR